MSPVLKPGEYVVVEEPGHDPWYGDVVNVTYSPKFGLIVEMRSEGKSRWAPMKHVRVVPRPQSQFDFPPKETKTA